MRPLEHPQTFLLLPWKRTIVQLPVCVCVCVYARETCVRASLIYLLCESLWWMVWYLFVFTNVWVSVCVFHPSTHMHTHMHVHMQSVMHTTPTHAHESA